MNKYIYKEYSPLYNKIFNSEKVLLEKDLFFNAHIEHFGSTSITNCGGKGILDIVFGLDEKTFNSQDLIKEFLDSKGYEFREVASFPSRLFFRKDFEIKNDVQRIHLHVVIFESKEWFDVIYFRNYLRAHADLVEEYNRIKRMAVEKARGDGDIYKLYKKDFIEKILEKAYETFSQPSL